MLYCIPLQLTIVKNSPSLPKYSYNRSLHCYVPYAVAETYLPNVNCELHIFVNSHVSAFNSPYEPSSSSDPTAPATNIALMKWSSVPCASRYCGCFSNRVRPRLRAGPEFLVTTSSKACLNLQPIVSHMLGDWENQATHSNAQLSGGVSCAKLSLYFNMGPQTFLYRLCTAPPLPTSK